MPYGTEPAVSPGGRMRGCDAVVRCLRAERIPFIAGITSGSTLELSDALLQAPEIKTILTRHERVAADIADGYARASLEPGVCLAVLGPGAGQLFGGIAQSYYDHVPVLALVGGTPRAQQGTNATQEMPVQDIFRPVTKWEGMVNMAARVPEFMRRAFNALRNGPTGPVLVELPSDVAWEEIEAEKFRYQPVTQTLRCRPEAGAVERAADLLLRATQPLLYAGAGVLWARATEELVELADLLGAPVMSTVPGKGAFPENHPLALGLGGFPMSSLGTPVAHFFAERTDCLLAVGNTFSGQATLRRPITRPVTLIHAHVDYQEVNRLYDTDVGLVGDAKLVLQDLIAAIKDRLGTKKRDASAVIAEVRRQKAAWLESWMSRLTSDEVPLNPYRITWDFMHVADRTRTTVLNDAGAVRGHLCHHYETIVPGGLIGMGNQSEMGWSLGAAIGAKLAHPDWLVAHVIGDGSFGMTGLDIETAVRYQIPILTLLYNNRSMGIVMDLQKAYFGERYTMIELGGDYVGVARALGAWAERVERPEHIRPTLERAIRTTQDGQPAVVEFMTKQLEAQPRPHKAPGEF